MTFMTFYSLAIPFYNLGQDITPWAADTRSKLQIQNTSLSVFFRQYLDRL